MTVLRTYEHTRPKAGERGRPLVNDKGQPVFETVWLSQVSSGDGESQSRLATPEEIAAAKEDPKLQEPVTTPAKSDPVLRTYRHRRPDGMDVILTEVGNSVSSASRPATAGEAKAFEAGEEKAFEAAEEKAAKAAEEKAAKAKDAL